MDGLIRDATTRTADLLTRIVQRKDLLVDVRATIERVAEDLLNPEISSLVMWSLCFEPITWKTARAGRRSGGAGTKSEILNCRQDVRLWIQRPNHHREEHPGLILLRHQIASIDVWQLPSFEKMASFRAINVFHSTHHFSNVLSSPRQKKIFALLSIFAYN